ncbi:hypothetical protein [Dyella nitratireducens]|uniref:Uncharacterized protein n=1 Tax=Dyella nitratireducens TaxID=1849580 RepID=A0ABQ1GNX6_9GAMM|nr:hypothetical protein [Dyella nitratireducens]GGA47440.1 hypothetical protein GCM10010981_40720 [Dyella nitratireducens]GLQ42450.1 hypothetical protein GCM10007902_23000 [Dyella nitratireducens]
MKLNIAMDNEVFFLPESMVVLEASIRLLGNMLEVGLPVLFIRFLDIHVSAVAKAKNSMHQENIALARRNNEMSD